MERLEAGQIEGKTSLEERLRELEQALETQKLQDPANRAGRCDLLVALANALVGSGEPLQAAEEVLPEALGLAETLGDTGRAAQVCRAALAALECYGPGVMWFAPVMSRWAESADHYAGPDTSDRVHADLAVAAAHAQKREWTQMRARALGAFDLALRLDDPELVFSAADPLIGVGWVAPHNQAERLRLVQELAVVPRTGTRSVTLAWFLWWSGCAALGVGDRARAEYLWFELDELASNSRDPAVSQFALRAQVRLATVDGRAEDALESGKELAARGKAFKAPVFIGDLENRMFFRPMIYLGRGEELRTSPWHDALSLAERVQLLAEIGRQGEASDALVKMLDGWHITAAMDDTPIGQMVRYLETSVLVQNREVARFIAARMAVVAPRIDDTQLTCIARHLGAAAALLGERAKARAYFQQALEVAGRARFRPEVALTRLGMAKLLLEEAEATAPPLRDSLRAEAAGHLEFAVAEFRSMKMQPALKEALKYHGSLAA